MSSFRRSLCLAFVLSLAFPAGAYADEQAIPPGMPEEGELSVNSGPDGICNTTASGDDTQVTPVGSAVANQPEIGCGPNLIVETAVLGDDVQLRPLSSTCANANVPVVDTGANGFAGSTAGGDDIYLPGMVLGTPPANTPCVGTGPDGLSGSVAAGDDVQEIAVGLGAPGQAVVLCGDDLIPSTTANNAVPGGDDTQVTMVSALPTCATPNDVVVASGPSNSISQTRAEGAELVLRAAKPLKVTIRSGDLSGSKDVKLQVYNQEFGAAASRFFRVNADDGNCPDGTLTLVDADPSADGLQLEAEVDQGGSGRLTMVATFHRDRVRSVSTRIPFRCEADITVVASDTNPEEDDARVRRNNSTKVTFEVFDYNDF